MEINERKKFKKLILKEEQTIGESQPEWLQEFMNHESENVSLNSIGEPSGDIRHNTLEVCFFFKYK